MAMFRPNLASAATTDAQRDESFVPVDAERPWMVTPETKRSGPPLTLGTRPGSKSQQTMFRPLSMMQVGELDEGARSEYFSDFRSAVKPDVNMGLLSAAYGTSQAQTLGGGQMIAGQSRADALAAYEMQTAAFGMSPPAPPVPGSFLPRAMQGQRAPNAPGAR
jgi:hypothetical protein